VCLDEKRVSDDRSKSAQGSNETELSNFLAKIEIELDATKMFVAMKCRQVALNWQFERPKRNQNCQRDKSPCHNSFP
jgi:hypothetical protein